MMRRMASRDGARPAPWLDRLLDLTARKLAGDSPLGG
jgi:hypothetical protein